MKTNPSEETVQPSVSDVPSVVPSVVKPEVLVVDVHVKAMKSTEQTQFYYIYKRWRVSDDQLFPERRNITLVWCAPQSNFFECQLEDGTVVTLHRNELLVESKEIKNPKE